MKNFSKIFVLTFTLMFMSAIVYAEPVRVGSKIDTEGALLGNMIVLVLKDSGIPVENKTELGPTNIVRQAITKGQIDIYPEYTGNGAYIFKDADKTAYKNWQNGYDDVKKLDYKHNKIVWLQPASANNTWAIAVTDKFAKANNVKTLEDMARYVNEGKPVKMAVSEEFATRPDTLPAFEEAYGFNVEDDQLVILSGGNTAQTEKALAQGTSGFNFAMAYGTDGAIMALGLRILEDTKEVQPVYAPAPIIREETLKAYPQIESKLNAVFATLDLETLQGLNAKVVVYGVPAAKMAKTYLQDNGFINK